VGPGILLSIGLGVVKEIMDVPPHHQAIRIPQKLGSSPVQKDTSAPAVHAQDTVPRGFKKGISLSL
jgi:hypothetical protein